MKKKQNKIYHFYKWKRNKRTQKRWISKVFKHITGKTSTIIRLLNFHFLFNITVNTKIYISSKLNLIIKKIIIINQKPSLKYQ